MKECAISHIKQDSNNNWIIQPNSEHQKNVAELSASFADQFGLSHIGYILGILHDEGKERLSFQNYIKRESGYDTSVAVENEHNHAFVGSIIAHNLCKKSPIADILFASPIASHHTGLHDYDEISNTVNVLNHTDTEDPFQNVYHSPFLLNIYPYLKTSWCQIQ